MIDIVGGISRSRQVLCFCGIPELDVQNSDTGNKQAYRNEDGYECIAHLLVPAKGFNHENAIHSLALASTESMVESIRNIHAEDKIFSILI